MSATLSSYRYDPATTPKRNVMLDDYDSLLRPAHRDLIEEVVFRAMTSEQYLQMALYGLWIFFCAARDVLDGDPDVSENNLYFSAVSTVLCRALAGLRSEPPPPPPSDPCSPQERRAMRQQVVANVHGARYPHYLDPLRIQVLRHQHLKWTAAMERNKLNQMASLGLGYNSDDSDDSEEDDLQIVIVSRVL
ncbi:hypothetical protein MIND_00831300 [Mycena indigotica]|uniref:Uncharacterized protein n=1 Tax=Mycena indigotica TaxID=2126181 RepID=A0A8H6SG13_9AGAR|nr:uncharacterized protein MIND_00831300 [Mycena indigotica]KAF7298836.1 hypothetical protein MIND_00831300 [Mycena indigotica]